MSDPKPSRVQGLLDWLNAEIAKLDETCPVCNGRHETRVGSQHLAGFTGNCPEHTPECNAQVAWPCNCKSA